MARMSVGCGACEACRTNWGIGNGKVCRSPKTVTVPEARPFESETGVNLVDIYGEDEPDVDR